MIWNENRPQKYQSQISWDSELIYDYGFWRVYHGPYLGVEVQNFTSPTELFGRVVLSLCCAGTVVGIAFVSFIFGLLLASLFAVHISVIVSLYTPLIYSWVLRINFVLCFHKITIQKRLVSTIAFKPAYLFLYCFFSTHLCISAWFHLYGLCSRDVQWQDLSDKTETRPRQYVLDPFRDRDGDVAAPETLPETYGENH